MAWNVQLSKEVQDAINGLHTSGSLSRVGLLRVYSSVRLVLPEVARRFQEVRYPADEDLFCYPVGHFDKGRWHGYTFYVNDRVQPGLLVVEGMDYESHS